MFRLYCPTIEETSRLCQQRGSEPLSYPEVGMTRDEAPPGYVSDNRAIELGAGEVVFRAACEAVRAWKMFELPWVRLLPPSAPVETGTVVAVVARASCLWAVGVCRIVYVEEDSRRFGFAYGTVSHVERGEERFLVEWGSDDRVWYTIRAYSRPGHWLIRAAYPFARYCQKCFGLGSLAAMKRAVAQLPAEPKLPAETISDKMP